MLPFVCARVYVLLPLMPVLQSSTGAGKLPQVVIVGSSFIGMEAAGKSFPRSPPRFSSW